MSKRRFVREIKTKEVKNINPSDIIYLAMKDGSIILIADDDEETINYDNILEEKKKIAKERINDNFFNHLIQKDGLTELPKDFFKFDADSSKFRFAITLGASPTSNPDIVKEYWKNKTGEDIKIEFHNPILFWYLDKGYTDEDLEEEFGPNWKEEVERLYKESLKENGKKTN